MRMRGWWMAAAGAAAALVACSGATGAVDCGADAGQLRVLFIGNSLTYANGLPYLVRALADSAGEDTPTVSDVTMPSVSLEDHWNLGDAVGTIRRACWDVVVLQQGPSALPESRALLIEYAERFAGEIHAAGATPALYSVWPSRARPFDFQDARDSYALAAEAADGMLLPVAAAWEAAWERDPRAPLYDPDGLHPSEAGSYLAALVIVGRLYGRSAAGLPAAVEVRAPGWSRPRVIRVDPALAATLQAAADDALAAGR